MRRLKAWPEVFQQHMLYDLQEEFLNGPAKVHFFFLAQLPGCIVGKISRPSCKPKKTASSPRLAYPFLDTTGLDFFLQQV